MIPVASPLPSWLKPSAAVDVAQLWFCIRPVMRTELALPVVRERVRRWARNYRFFAALDDDGFLVLSRTPCLSRRTLDLDRGPGDHTFALGRGLGYPYCCCRKAALMGDASLDALADRFCSEDFFGRFNMINPLGYCDGHALISHIPCSPRCVPSLKMAEALAQKLNHCRGSLTRSPMSAQARRVDSPRCPKRRHRGA
jgi:hypothetical protein